MEEEAAGHVVEQGLAVCATAADADSIYIWQGETVNDEEVIGLFRSVTPPPPHYVKHWRNGIRTTRPASSLFLSLRARGMKTTWKAGKHTVKTLNT